MPLSNKVKGLYSCENPRLIALLTLQAVWWGNLVEVLCRIYADEVELDPKCAAKIINSIISDPCDESMSG
jgi:hypothetical protein